jgi:heterodisulfide reductase subunit B
LPVLFLPQLLGLALGLAPEDLGVGAAEARLLGCGGHG